MGKFFTLQVKQIYLLPIYRKTMLVLFHKQNYLFVIKSNEREVETPQPTAYLQKHLFFYTNEGIFCANCYHSFDTKLLLKLFTKITGMTHGQ